ncbi:MerR family DNA-binding transcriptional regulator [Jiangella muralis]|uniref:MerR family DNA-binding transcriptional regulator n=1 Tax=Jiangella muralis TaxID=702383 RepID=UPI00069D05E9|nr:MerR family DNA-binding transcriptional regulator [Jiangella muralis]
MQLKHAWNGDEELIPVGEAASMLGVHPDTLKRWERAGKITSDRTPTGHRRFRRGDVRTLLTPAASNP